MAYRLSFYEVKVGDKVVMDYSFDADLKRTDNLIGEVVRVSPTRFVVKYVSTYGETIESTNKKEDGERYGWTGHRVLAYDTPESRDQYNALLVKRHEDDLERERRIEVANELNQKLKTVFNLSYKPVDAYGGFTTKLYLNEQQALALTELLTQLPSADVFEVSKALERFQSLMKGTN